MNPFSRIVWGLALMTLGAGAGSARAAWCNVFQVGLFHREPVVAYYYAPPAGGCGSCCEPCQTCTTRYVQRCYYQPVVTYQTKSYYEPVTTYRTSYYYEPVTSYRYSCYYDPCSCSYQQVATPTVSYQVRSQCCPVQSWVQRCCSVPVTTYQQSSYWEPVTTCCAPTCAAPTCGSGCATAAPSGSQDCCQGPAAGGSSSRPPASISEGRSGAAVSEPGANTSDNLPNDRRYIAPQNVPQGNSNKWTPGDAARAPVRNLAPAVRLDRVVVLQKPIEDK